MSVDFTHADINRAADAAWNAIHGYAKQHGVCAGCLGAYVILDMLFHAVKNTVADAQLTDFRALLDNVWNAALAARNGGKPNPNRLH